MVEGLIPYHLDFKQNFKSKEDTSTIGSSSWSSSITTGCWAFIYPSDEKYCVMKLMSNMVIQGPRNKIGVEMAMKDMKTLLPSWWKSFRRGTLRQRVDAMSKGEVALYGEKVLLSPPTMSIGGTISRTRFPFHTHVVATWQQHCNDAALWAIVHLFGRFCCRIMQCKRGFFMQNISSGLFTFHYWDRIHPQKKSYLEGSCSLFFSTYLSHASASKFSSSRWASPNSITSSPSLVYCIVNLGILGPYVLNMFH